MEDADMIDEDIIDGEDPEVKEETEDEVGEGCIEGMRCPKCKQHERFKISARSTFMVMEDGTDEHEDVEWDGPDYARCPDCDWEGKVDDLYPKKEAQNEA